MTNLVLHWRTEIAIVDVTVLLIAMQDCSAEFEVASRLYSDEKAHLTILALVQAQQEDARTFAKVEVEFVG